MPRAEQGSPEPGEGESRPGGGDGEEPGGKGGSGSGPNQQGAAQPQTPEPRGGGSPRQDNSQRSPRLPQFDPQKDMSADQAANLLEAVENLEREQRRAQADEERRQRARRATEKDW